MKLSCVPQRFLSIRLVLSASAFGAQLRRGSSRHFALHSRIRTCSNRTCPCIRSSLLTICNR